jgi:threonine/homoserine/homoserine lactone efflux protein
MMDAAQLAHGIGGPELYWLLSATGFAIAMSATPGPNNVMVASSGATYGFARTVPHFLGVSGGFAIMVAAVALGAGEVLHAYPVIHEILKWVGAAYMLWLAWRIATARPDAKGVDEAGSARARKRGRPLTVLEAALFQWVNPKAWVIALGAVATYTTTGGAVMGQALILALIFFIVCVPSTALWTAIGAGTARLLRTERAVRAFNLAMAVLLVASLVTLFVEI